MIMKINLLKLVLIFMGTILKCKHYKTVLYIISNEVIKKSILFIFLYYVIFGMGWGIFMEYEI